MELINNDLLIESQSCKDVTFTIFGISLATFNAVISFIISYILLKLIFKNE